MLFSGGPASRAAGKGYDMCPALRRPPAACAEGAESIRRWCPRSQYRLAVGANAIGPDTRAYLDTSQAQGATDCFVESRKNLNKCPMMRLLFEQVETEYIWWFDDDSYLVDSGAFRAWLDTAEQAPKQVVMWGKLAVCNHSSAFAPDREDALGFVRSAAWYRGLPPPSWRAGGKGEFNFGGHGLGDGRWFFILGGCWLIRTSAVRALDWPDRRLIKMGDDVFLGEAIRQHGWRIANMETTSVAINTARRRGEPGVQLTSRKNRSQRSPHETPFFSK